MIKKHINWEEVELAIRTLAYNIRSSELKLTHIKGLQRGGLVPAVMLSHELGIPMLESDLGRIDDRVLIVDDICDSGKTLEYFGQFRCPTATIHYKKTASVTPTFWFELAGAEWIVYPWERRDSATVPDYLVGGNLEIKEF
jgi:hypoxanthine phosphoribosyltransferase